MQLCNFIKSIFLSVFFTATLFAPKVIRDINMRDLIDYDSIHFDRPGALVRLATFWSDEYIFVLKTGEKVSADKNCHVYFENADLSDESKPEYYKIAPGGRFKVDCSSSGTHLKIIDLCAPDPSTKNRRYCFPFCSR